MNWNDSYKLTATTLAAVCAFTVHASFELVLVADDTNKLVHRYDGGSGILLGTFGGGGFLTAARGVAVDQANNTAIVLEGTSSAKFNYNTGEFLGDSFFLGFNATEMTRLRDGSILFWGANNCARYSSSGSFLSFYGVSGGLTIKEGALGPDGRIYLTTNDGAGAQRIHWFPLSGGAETANAGWLNDNMASDSTYMLTAYNQGGSNTVFERWTPLSNGGPITTYNSITVGSLTCSGSAAVGHDGMGYFGTNVGGLAKVSRFDYQGLRYRGAFGSFGTVNGISVVVAPEPGTMLALGLGAAALLKRRRMSA